MIDYGVEYATILPSGLLLLDLSPIRVTGPMVPIIRVCRTWIELVDGAIERTIRRSDEQVLAAQLQAAGLAVDHVLTIDPITATIGADKVLTVIGYCSVGGSKVYPLNVTINKLGEALASIES